MEYVFKKACPTCGTLCKAGWVGLEDVKNSGDESLAHLVYRPMSNQEIREHVENLEKEIAVYKGLADGDPLE